MRSIRLAVLVTILAIIAITSACGGDSVNIEKVKYFDQPNCYKLSNGEVEVIVTSDIGPRIIRYSFIGGENILAELGTGPTIKTELGDWHPYGGHRLWHAPEVLPRTYVPDNKPVKVEQMGRRTISLTEDVEEATGIEKIMMVHLDETGTRVTVTHTLRNKGLWTIELAPWALTIMNGGGTTIIPNEPYISHDEKLLPARVMAIWHYTDFSDSRWKLGKKYIRVSTDEKIDEPQKVGVADKQGWAGYLRKGEMFIKSFTYEEGAKYPDGGCNCETYTAGTFMELESLAPLVNLDAGKSVSYVEHWNLFKGVDAGATEETLESALKPLLAKVAAK